MIRKTALKLLIAWCTPLFIFVFAGVALADDPDCIPVSGGEFYLTTFNDGSNDPTNTTYAFGPPDGLSADFKSSAGNWRYWSWSPDTVLSGTIAITITVTNDGDVDNTAFYVHPDLNASINDPGWVAVFSSSYLGQIGSVRYANYGDPLGGGWTHLDSIEFSVDGCYYGLLCATVDDYHFAPSETLTETWLLSAGAGITDSILTLPPGESASQDLSLSNTDYNAVISVTNVVTPASLDVYLTGLQNIVLTGTGLYTVPFEITTAATYTYQMVNHPASAGDVDINYTCLYPTSITNTEIICIAPTNGEFDTADNWDWHYNARWNESGLNAYLPYNDTVSDTGKSLVVSSGVYSLPNLITDTYLILGFESMALGKSGVVASRVGDSWQEFDVNSSLYRFEADISSQAGLTLTTVSFANSGAPGGEYAAVDDLTVDNVCLYVSDTPPNIPTPTNPWLSPFDFGFNFTCGDVPALLAGYGIDVYTPAAVYQSGVITWTEQNWVPWLAGAVWNNAGAPVSCFLVEFMRLTAGIAEQFINNYTNVVNWNYETLTYGVPWLAEGMMSPSSNMSNFLNWYAYEMRGPIYYNGENIKSSTSWNRYGFIELQNTMSDNTLDVGAETGSVISTIMDQLMWMWNTSVVPWMNYTSAAANSSSVDESTGESILELFDWITGTISGLLNLIWSVLSWLAGLFTMAGDVPVEVYHSVRDGISSEAYSIEVMCTDSNFWCYFWAGVQIVNQTVSQTIAYPLVITGLIIVTLVVVMRNLLAMFSIEIG